MTIFEALVLGVVQGITEFLPVSSSGHLVLLQKIFGITEPALVFDTAVHGGTLIAVLVVLRQDIWNILKRIFQPLTLYLIIATIPAVIAAMLFKSRIEEAFASGAFLGFAFIATSALLFTSEKLFRLSQKPGADLYRPDAGTSKPGAGTSKPGVGLSKSGAGTSKPEAAAARPQGEMNWADALVIGLLQAAAIIPGLSRSGATISAALSRRLDRDFAARFSFLLSIPAILGALVLQAKDLAGAGHAGATAGPGGIGAAPLIAGVLSACIVAFFSIRLTLKIVRERSLFGFSIYTGVLGLLVLLDKFGTRFFF